ncbi:hypothetical protein [Kocuria sp.]|uniref:hypothetical protein n=1 Tax=Kocuria sp. TaxID=1871328 RepID=UPI0026DF12E9|nr:hypothetical protein [Kocuria sp.]MDO5619285.1 hypothetical protein [Kocuria sp.]
MTVTKQARQVSDRGRSSSETALVFNATASDAAGALRRALQAVVWLAAPSGRFVFDDDADALVKRALDGWPQVCRAEDVALRYEQLVVAVRDAVRVMDREPERKVAGTCDCGASLVSRQGQSEVRCRRCGVLWEVEDLAQMRAAKVAGHLQRFVSAEEMAGLFSLMGKRVPAATIRQWVKRGKVQVYAGPYPLHGIWAADAWEAWQALHGTGVESASAA